MRLITEVIMDLTEFSSLTLHTPNEAKNFMSFLLGYNFSDKVKSEKAILAMFGSLPQSFKDDKKLFAPVFAKFFEKFPVSESNISYYNHYITDKVVQTTVIKNNPNWNFAGIEYNTLAEYCKAFEAMLSLNINGQQHAWEFLNDTKDNLLKFSKASKTKTEDALIFRGIFTFLLKRDYGDFKEFCNTHSFNSLEVLQRNQTNFSWYLDTIKSSTLNNSELISVLNDVVPVKANFFLGDPFLEHFQQGKNHVSTWFFKFILKEKVDVACTLLEYFESEVMDGIHKTTNIKNPILDYATLEELGKNLSWATRSWSDSTLRDCDTQKDFSERLTNFLEYYHVIRQAEKLDNDLPKKSGGAKKIKI